MESVLAKLSPLKHIVVPRKTNFILKNPDSLTIQEIYDSIINDENRNELIFDDLLTSLDQGRTPILLTERVTHVEYFQNRLKKFVKNVVVLRGGMGKKQQKEIFAQLAKIPDEEERVIIATGKYIGEGFDDHRLDTLFLVMPISWKGTLQQYAGRLHRVHTNKKTVKIYDYVDTQVPMLMKMFEKRKKSYKAMGYTIEE